MPDMREEGRYQAEECQAEGRRGNAGGGRRESTR